ncbi:hypothetical protein T11_7022 [Trichinella zimbabwensis]|uniref:Uncharacterized protein n=1 Tax=Trichinella zimbabwensis TaxID=268475 RepID=A0A0V1GAX4_9BILA|nr:hypothetical protein T11_7022 [Trichinella zimbabwensis]
MDCISALEQVWSHSVTAVSQRVYTRVGVIC